MASRGATETSKLQANVEEQLNRLLSQLKDIEEMKGDLSPEEYQSTKAETIEQLKEFDASLKKMMGGNMTLVSSLGAVQLAIQGAIRGAFKTPEIVSLFAKKQPGQLRQRLANIERDAKLGKIPESQATGQQVEILTALVKLGDPLTPQERTFLQANSDQALLDFQKADTSLGKARNYLSPLSSLRLLRTIWRSKCA